MAVTYGFYNSSNGDRKYNSVQMARLFEGIINDGVFASIGETLKVAPAGEMQITVGSGRAWFKNTWTNNDAPLILTLERSETLLNRIDAVILEVGTSSDRRHNEFKIVKGSPATSPLAPTLINTEGLYQYALAYITIPAGATSIVVDNINSRINTPDFPFVRVVGLDALLPYWQDMFDDWFADLQDQMDENALLNLQNQVNTKLTSDGGDGKDVVVTFTEAANVTNIASGDKLSTMFGKILKTFKRTQPVSLGGTGQTTAANAIKALGIGYGTCTTAAGTAAKVGTLSGFSLVVGGVVGIRFTNANTHASPTLNVGGTGAKAIGYNNAPPRPGQITAGMVAYFQYDGSYWNLLNPDIGYTIVTRTTSGNWTVPAGVTEIDILTIDGGGGGAKGLEGRSNASSTNPHNGYMRAGNGGKGGAAGTLKNGKVKVVPGEVIAIVIGAGGAGSTNDSPTTGGSTSVSKYSNFLLNAQNVGGGDGGAGDDYGRNSGDYLYTAATVGSNGNSNAFGFGSIYANLFSGAGGGGGRRPTDGSVMVGGTSAGGGDGGNGGKYNTTGSNGSNATVYGAGGGGSGGSGSPPQAASNTTNTCANTSVGGAGKSGVVYIGYYTF